MGTVILYVLGDLHANAASTKDDPADTERRRIQFD